MMSKGLVIKNQNLDIASVTQLCNNYCLKMKELGMSDKEVEHLKKELDIAISRGKDALSSLRELVNDQSQKLQQEGRDVRERMHESTEALHKLKADHNDLRRIEVARIKELKERITKLQDAYSAAKETCTSTKELESVEKILGGLSLLDRRLEGACLESAHRLELKLRDFKQIENDLFQIVSSDSNSFLLGNGSEFYPE